MTAQDRKVVLAMKQYGGSFISTLGHAAMFADEDNLAKIKATWSDEWEKYTAFAEQREKE